MITNYKIIVEGSVFGTIAPMALMAGGGLLTGGGSLLSGFANNSDISLPGNTNITQKNLADMRLGGTTLLGAGGLSMVANRMNTMKNMADQEVMKNFQSKMQNNLNQGNIKK